VVMTAGIAIVALIRSRRHPAPRAAKPVRRRKARAGA